jgi:phosphoglycerate dehydrogenase-like enzyme
VIVTNTSGLSSVPMAEHTMGLILALARNLPDALRYQQQGKWAQQELWDKPQRLNELKGMLLLIVGYGSIGREVARRAGAFGMRVWGVTRSGRGDATGVEKIFPIAQLHEALPHADYVVIAAPDTYETRGLIGGQQISQMKRGARLINVSRGSLLDEAALVAALQNGALSGAALDVTEVEPLPSQSGLWTAPNLFITPHTSAISDQLCPRETELLLKLLSEWFGGKELSNRVDLSRGY